MSFFKNIFKSNRQEKESSNQKSRKSGNIKGEVIPVVEKSYLPNIDYKFSDDEVGKQLQTLWTSYLSACDVSIESDDCFISFKQLSAFNEFAAFFQTSYSYVRNLPLIDPETISQNSNYMGEVIHLQPASYKDAKGHPVELIVLLGKLLFDFLDMNKSMDDDEVSPDPYRDASTEKQDQLLGSEELRIVNIRGVFHDPLRRACTSKADLLVDSSTLDETYHTSAKIALANIISTLSLLLSWKYNIAVIENKLGEDFALTLVSLLAFFSCKVDELINSWRDIKISADLTVELKEILDAETTYSMSMLQLLTILFTRSSTTMKEAIAVTNFGYLPSQPWSEKNLQTMGCEKLVSLRKLSFAEFDDDSNETKSSFMSFVGSKESVILPSLRPIQLNTNSACWSGELIKSGADKVLITLLKKLCLFGRVLTCTIGIKKGFDDQPAGKTDRNSSTYNINIATNPSATLPKSSFSPSSPDEVFPRYQSKVVSKTNSGDLIQLNFDGESIDGGSPARSVDSLYLQPRASPPKQVAGDYQVMYNLDEPSMNNGKVIQMTETDLMIAEQWKMCLIIQCEVLFNLLCFLASHPKATCRRFLLCEGIQMLNSLLLDSPTLLVATIDFNVIRDLTFHRGVLCLRINELLVQRFSTELSMSSSIPLANNPNASVNSSFDEEAIVLISESLSCFFSWINASFLSYDDADTQREEKSETASHENIVMIECIPFKEIKFNDSKSAENLPSDLWPWRDTQMNSESEDNSKNNMFKKSKGPSDGGSYILCHGSEGSSQPPLIPSGSSSAATGGRELSNNLRSWAVYVEKCCQCYVTCDEDSLPDLPSELPWFLKGGNARAWAIVFSILLGTCTGSNGLDISFDIRRRFMTANFDMLLNALATSFDEKVGTTVSTTPTRDPLLQIHYLIFISRCLYRSPANTIDVCNYLPKMWSMLFLENFALSEIHKLDILNNSSSQPPSPQSPGRVSREYSLSSEEFDDISIGMTTVPPAYVGNLRVDQKDQSGEATPIWKISCTSPSQEHRQAFTAYKWLTVHDFSLDLAQSLVHISHRPPANKLVRSSNGYDIKPIIHALQMACEKKYDICSFQLLRWMSWYIAYITLNNVSALNAISYQFQRAALAVCGYHLSSLGVISIHQKKQFSPIVELENVRPFMWPTRLASVELITLIIAESGCDKWLSLYLPAKGDVDNSEPASRKLSSADRKSVSNRERQESLSSLGMVTNTTASSLATPQLQRSVTDKPSTPPTGYVSVNITKSRTKTPAHLTTVLLFVDARLRKRICLIITQLIRTIVLKCLAEAKDVILEDTQQPTARNLKEDSYRMDSISRDSSMDQGNTSGTSSVRKSIWNDKESMPRRGQICIYNLISDMFEHIKASSAQPEWTNSKDIAFIILTTFTQFIRSYRKLPERMQFMQKLFTRNNLISELITAITTTVHLSKASQWSSEVKSSLVNIGFAFLTSLMIGNEFTRDDFKAAIASRKVEKMGTISKPNAASGRAFGSSSSSTPTSSRDKLSLNSNGALSVTSSNAISGNNSNGEGLTIETKVKFTNVLYDEFVEIILIAESVPSIETVIVLMEMILDGSFMGNRRSEMIQSYKENPSNIILGFFANQFDRPHFRNVSAIPILFGIIPYCPIELQKCILNCFQSLVVGRGSLENISICNQMHPSLLDFVLDLFPILTENVQIVAFNLLQSIGTHNISVAQLKRIFQMMQSNGENRPAYTWRLLKALQGMIGDGEVPRHSFVFGGSQSGLNLPRMIRWPAQTAYTFVTWLRIESSLLEESSNQDGNNGRTLEYRPYVLCLRCSTNGAGLEIFLKRVGTTNKFRVHIQVWDSYGDNESYQLPGTYVIEGKWHFFAVAQSSGSFRSKNDLEIMLDNQFVRCQTNFPYPVFPDSIDYPLLGDCVESFRDSNVNTTMRGQMSGVYFLQDALTEGQLQGIYGLGASYFYGFERYSIVHRDLPTPSTDKKLAVDPILSVLDGSLSSLIMLAYNPAVWKGEYYLDNTPEKNQIKWKLATSLLSSNVSAVSDYNKNPTKQDILASEVDDSSGTSAESFLPMHIPGKMHARSLPGTYRTTSQNIRIALNSLGGIQVLLPIFAQFDQPRLKVIHSTIDNVLTMETVTDNSPDSELCPVLFQLLICLLGKSSENHYLLKDLQGIQLISFFLERVSPSHISLDVLKLLFKLRLRLSWNKLHANSVLENILLNFRIFVFTSYEVQSCLLDEIQILLLNEDIKILRNIKIVDRLLDALYLLYGYERSDIHHILVASKDDQQYDRQSALGRSNSISLVGSSTTADILNSLSSPSVDRLLKSTSVDNTQNDLFGSVHYYSDRWIHHTSGAIEGVKLKGVNLQKIRKRIWDILFQLIMKGQGDKLPGPEDVLSIVKYITNDSNPHCKVEGIRFLLKLFTKPNDEDISAIAPRLLIGLCCHRGLLTMFPLFEDSSPNVRLYMLVFLCTVVHYASMYRSSGETIQRDYFDNPLLGLKNVSFPPGPNGEPPYVPVEPIPSVDITAEDYKMKTNVTHTSIPMAYVAFGNAIESSNDIFDWLGIPISTLSNTFVSIQDKLLNSITRNSEYKYSNYQYRIIAQSLQLCLLGESCTHLTKEIDNCLSLNFEEIPVTAPETNAEVMTKEDSGFQENKNDFSEIAVDVCVTEDESPAESPASTTSTAIMMDSLDLDLPVKGSEFTTPPPKMSRIKEVPPEEPTPLINNDNSAQNLRTLADAKVCAPFIFLALLDMCRCSSIPITLRLSIIVNLRVALVISDDNCDRIMRIPAWQDWFIGVLVEESRHIKAISKLNLSSSSNLKELEKSQALVDTCLRTLCDIQVAAVRIGKPKGAAYVTSLNALRLNSRYQLTQKTILLETSNGERELGVSVLRETLSFLRITDVGILDVKLTAYSLLQSTVNALQRECDTVNNRKRGVSTSTIMSSDIMLNMYFQKILQLNIWLVGAVILEFITVPSPSSGKESIDAVSTNAPLTRRDSESSLDGILSPSRAYSTASSLNIDLAGSNTLNSLAELSPFVPHAAFATDFEDYEWAIVESLVKLIFPYGPSDTTDSWLLNENSLRLPSGQEVYVNSKVINQMNDGVNQVLPIQTPVHNPGSGSNANSNYSQQQSPMKNAAGSVSWIMIRLLCSVFANGAAIDHNGDVDGKALQALQMLKALMNIFQNKNIENFDFEALNVICRLTGVLQIVQLPPSSEWVRSAVQLLMDLVSIHRSALCERITELDDAGKMSSGSNVYSNSRYKSSGVVNFNTSSKSPPTNRKPEFIQLMEKYSGAQNIELTVSDMTLEALRKSLNLPESMDLDWRIWNYVMQPIMLEADRTAAEAVKQCLTEIGLHKHSEEIRTYLEQVQTMHEKISYEITRYTNIANARMINKHGKYLWEYFKYCDTCDKRVLSKWNIIVSRLVNERGPWAFGYGAGVSSREVFWTQCNLESNSRTRYLLTRNDVGTKHQMASLIAQGKLQARAAFVDDTDALDPFKSKAQEVSAAIPQGLWRDLTKYRKQGKRMEINAEPDRFDIEDENGENEHKNEALDTGRVLFKCDVEMINTATNSTGRGAKGTFEITKSRMSFTRHNENQNLTFENKSQNHEFLWACQSFPSTVWNTNDILDVLSRTYQLRRVALEIFFTSRTAVFFNFEVPSTARQVFDIIRRQVRPPYILPNFGYKPSNIIQRHTLTPQSQYNIQQSWVNREISNYDYLMLINKIAGRSYNDLSQYPVFPWVLADYTSYKLNLTDPRIYRDLKWPMGAQNESQRGMFMDKYEDLNDCYREAVMMADRDGSDAVDVLPPFHYGTHYSCMGFVLWYLLRCEPYTSLNIWMQDGKLDKSDRMFDSIELAYRGCATNQNDVKELIPEFFSTPEFLENRNNIDFGTTQNGKRIDEIKLPNWAKSPHDFIRQNRNALESEYVSANLHHWIDLVFGYKQRPPHMGGTQDCVDACNVFFHLTYEGAVALEELRENDSPLYEQMVRQISNFGQTPTQLFTKKHPQRKPLGRVDIFWPIASVVNGIDTIPKGDIIPERPREIIAFKEQQISAWPIILIGEMSSDKLVTVDTSRVIATHFWQIRAPDMVPPFQFKPDINALKFSQGISSGGVTASISAVLASYSNSGSRERRVGVAFAPYQILRSDITFEVSTRIVRLKKGNKALYEQEEMLRSQVSKPSRRRENNDASNTGDSRRKLLEAYEPSKAVSFRRVDEHLSNHLFALLPEYRLLFSCGHWDYSFKVTGLDSGKILQSVSLHRSVVTCMALATEYDKTWLVTGSRDCTVIIWAINPLNELPVDIEPLSVLYGHDDSVNCIAVSYELDIVVSGSDDGTIIIHSLRTGTYIRSFFVNSDIPKPVAGLYPTPDNDNSQSALGNSSIQNESFGGERSVNTPASKKRRVHWVGVSSEGYIVAYSNDDCALYSFSVNGSFLARKFVGDTLYAFRFSEDNKVIVSGGERGLIVMRHVHSLELSNTGSKYEFDSILDGSCAEYDQLPFNSPIRCIYFTKQEKHMIVGLESGYLRILAQDSDYLRRRLHSKLMEIGILEKIEGT